MLRWIRLHPAIFTKQYPDRWVNNVYYDTHDYHSYTSNLSGESSRSKIRFRWYGELSRINTGTLEIKMKRNSYGWKINHAITFLHLTGTIDWRNFTKKITEQLPMKYKQHLLSRPVPTIINRYHREYYISHDEKIRLTIDRKHNIFDQRQRSTMNITKRAVIPDNLVIEVKFDRKYHNTAASVIHGIPIRSSRNSKYINSINAVSGNSRLFP